MPVSVLGSVHRRIWKAVMHSGSKACTYHPFTDGEDVEDVYAFYAFAQFTVLYISPALFSLGQSRSTCLALSPLSGPAAASSAPFSSPALDCAIREVLLFIDIGMSS